MSMDNKIVFIADIADDIDDIIAIEYLNSVNILECVVLDGKSRNIEREQRLSKIGVFFKKGIPIDAKILFCGGALTKIAEFVEKNKIHLLVANGGFAGNNIISKKYQLNKFKGKDRVRTYNFNMDIDAALSVIYSENIKDILLVSKNVCHSELNCIGKIHTDNFLLKYNLNKGKRLHDLLMAKEGVSYIKKDVTICNYANIVPICDRKLPDNMSYWGSKLNISSNIKISTSFKS